MNFSENKLPSSMEELDGYWKQHVQEEFSFTEINIHRKKINYNLLI